MCTAQERQIEAVRWWTQFPACRRSQLRSSCHRGFMQVQGAGRRGAYLATAGATGKYRGGRTSRRRAQPDTLFRLRPETSTGGRAETCHMPCKPLFTSTMGALNKRAVRCWRHVRVRGGLSAGAYFRTRETQFHKNPMKKAGCAYRGLLAHGDESVLPADATRIVVAPRALPTNSREEAPRQSKLLPPYTKCPRSCVMVCARKKRPLPTPPAATRRDSHRRGTHANNSCAYASSTRRTRAPGFPNASASTTLVPERPDTPL